MTIDANRLETFRLEDGGVALSLLNYGAITHGWWVRQGSANIPVVLGYRDPTLYLSDEAYIGAIVGRIANRTGGGKLVVDGQSFQLTQNEGINHLHGGRNGLNRKLWAMEKDSANRAVRLSVVSPDGDEGYPGEARISVTVTLQGNTVTYDMQAMVDRPTPINLAQHNYYNLMGQGTIWPHVLTSPADRMTPTEKDGIPTGRLGLVRGSCLDFTEEITFGVTDPGHKGIDVNLVLPDLHDPIEPIAEVRAHNGLQLRVWSDQPGFQLYTGAALQGSTGAHGDQTIKPFAGFCLEPQGYPNAVNTPAFPSIMVTPEMPYRQTTRVEIMEVPV
ncbi:MAG: aldose epimerase family protein [Cohaesibacteraceae bacterium]